MTVRPQPLPVRETHTPLWWHPELQHRLLAAARRLSQGNPADAADLVQEGYLKLITRGTDDLDSVTAWLLTVQRHLAVDRIRHKRLETQWLELAQSDGLADEVVQHNACTSESPEDTLERQQTCERALWRLVSRLSSSEVAVLLLREVFDWDFAELANLLGKSPAAVRQMMVRLRAKLRRHIDSDDPTSGANLNTQEALVRTCLAALLQRDAGGLTALVRQTPPAARFPAARFQAPTHNTTSGQSAATQCHVQSVGGGYVLALVFDNLLLCTLPLGPLAASAEQPELHAAGS